jgi:hypothetical protein
MYTYVYLYAVYIYLYLCMFMFMCIFVYIHINIYIYIYMNIHTYRYTELKDKMGSIEKDKVLRQSPFEAGAQILQGQLPFAERYDGFFMDYSLPHTQP